MSDDYTPTVNEVGAIYERHISGARDSARAAEFDRMIARIRAEAIQEAVAAIRAAAPPINAELSMPGGAGPFVDRRIEAYIEGFHEAHNAVAALDTSIRSDSEEDR